MKFFIKIICSLSFLVPLSVFASVNHAPIDLPFDSSFEEYRRLYIQHQLQSPPNLFVNINFVEKDSSIDAAISAGERLHSWLEVINAKRSNPLANVSDEELDKLKVKLNQILEHEKRYLDEDLTLTTLAQQLDTTDKKLSTLLNQYINTNFYDLINSYRIEAVKEKMSLTAFDGLTLLGIAYESGFKSKTSFNRIFKKETGKSPSEFKKSLQKLN